MHCLYEFANTRLQRASWIEGPSADWPDGRPWVSSFVESMCTYFDDLGLSEGYESRIGEGLVTPREAGLAASFHVLADFYDPTSDADHGAILADPNWQAVVDAAVALWSALKRETRDPFDQATIGDLEKRFGEVGDP
ncbi:MAG: hypothetical protein GY719_32880 [bacterium]|nr:hypothetical protein [bacterium]